MATASVKATTTEKPKEPEEQQPPWVLFGVLLGVALCFLLAYGRAVGDTRAALLEVMLGGAALSIGGLLGFLFGIPHERTMDMVSQPADPRPPTTAGLTGATAPDPDPSGGYRPSTNLEQVSDWLTKILVGVGLVELRRVGDVLSKIATVVQSDLIPPPSGIVVVTQVVAVFCLIVGFGIAYLWTRLPYSRMQVALDSAIRADLLSFKRTMTARLDRNEMISKAALGPSQEEEEGATRHRTLMAGTRTEWRVPDTWPPDVVDRVREFLMAPPEWNTDPTAHLFPNAPRTTRNRQLQVEWAAVSTRVVLTISVSATSAPPLQDSVTFLLHPTFVPRVIELPVDDGIAELTLAADGVFTVIAIADDGRTILGYNLDTLPGIPAWFRQ